MSRIVLSVVLLLGSGLALLWPALYNGQPFFFDDTPTYLRGVDAGVYRLTGHRTVWTRAAPAVAAPPAASGTAAPGGRAAPAAAEDPTAGRTPLAGRSIYYGALLYAGERSGFWLTLALQAAALLLALGLTLRHWGGFSMPRLALVAAVLALLTPAAFYTGYLMPDLFAGVTVLAVAALVVHGRHMGRGERLLWLGLLVAALLFHSSHVLLTAALLALALPWWLWRRRSLSGAGIALAALALGLGLAGEAAFQVAVQRLAGVKPVRPPFLMARLIADGPGYTYLQRHCPQAGFTVCHYLDRLPTLNSDVFLWSEDPRLGVFMAEDGTVKRRLSEEQLRFALAVIADDPLAWLRSAARNAWHQLAWFGVPEFNYTGLQKDNYRQRLPEPYRSALLASRAGQGAMPVAAMTRVIYAGTLASLALLAVAAWRRRGRPGRDPVIAFAALVVVGVVANALICGLLSTPHDRYQARVVWLLPLLVALLALRARPLARPYDNEM